MSLDILDCGKLYHNYPIIVLQILLHGVYYIKKIIFQHKEKNIEDNKIIVIIILTFAKNNVNRCGRRLK